MKEIDSLVALKRGVLIIVAQPGVLVAALLGAVVSAVLYAIPVWSVAASSWWPGLNPELGDLLVVGLLLPFLSLFLFYILFFVSLDMARDAYSEQRLDSMKSLKLVFGRPLTFIFVSVVGAFLSVTIVLTPVTILMFVILVIDEAGILSAIRNSFRVLAATFTDSIVLVVISVFGGFVLSLVPVFGAFLTAVFNVLVGLAFIDVYYSFKEAR